MALNIYTGNLNTTGIETSTLTSTSIGTDILTASTSIETGALTSTSIGTDIIDKKTTSLELKNIKISTTGYSDSGGLRYNAGNLEYHNGTTWIILGSSSSVLSSDVTVLNDSLTKSVQDFINTQEYGTMEPPIITNNLDGTISITNSVCSYKKTNVGESPIYFGTIPELLNLSLTDNSLNYIYVDGSTQSYKATISDILGTYDYRNIIIASVYRSGTTLYINRYQLFGGISKGNKAQQRFQESQRLTYARGSGLSSSGLNISIEAGIYYFCLNRIATTAFNSSITQFIYWYYNGSSWINSLSNTINNTQYNNTSSGLTTLTNNRWKKDSIYIGVNSDVHIVYGSAQYTSLANAETSTISNPPTWLDNNYGSLVGVIILQKNAVTMTTRTAYGTTVNLSDVSDHANLSGLTDTDNHTQYALLSGRASDILNINTINGINNLTLNGTTGNMYIGNSAGESRIYSTNIYFQNIPTGSGDGVDIDVSTGQLYKVTSSKKYKQDINYINKNNNLDKILGLIWDDLSPTTYKYISSPENIHLGLIAEDVEQACKKNKIDPKYFVTYTNDNIINGINFRSLQFLTMRILQKKQDEINDLKTRILTIEKKLKIKN